MRKAYGLLSLAAAICLTAGVQSSQVHAKAQEGKRAKVTGIGGVFFLAHGDAKALASWYEEHLGIRIEAFGGGALRWEDDTAEDGGVTIWHAADPDSEWFSPSKASFMINYRVDDLDTMIVQLNAAGVTILKGPEYHENGAFAWILDPDGNKIELWEPKIWDAKNKR